MKFKDSDSKFKDSDDMIWKDPESGFGVVIDPVIESLAVEFQIESLAVEYRLERA
jgi:hypothetical protein